jgi:hypothetical protein
MADRFEVFPDGDEWGYQRRSDEGEITESESGYADRKEAVAAARLARGDKIEELFRMDDDGNFESIGLSTISRGDESLVLLRPDGSVYGEIDHEVNKDSSQNPQHVSITPASEASEAGFDG